MRDISKLYDEINKRESKRAFSDKSIDKTIEQKINEFIRLHRMDGAYIGFLNGNSDHIFKGIVGSYGKVKNSQGYFLVSGADMAKSGYLGELALLFAQYMGLSSCWVSGMFDKTKVKKDINPNHKIYATIALGYSKEIMNFEKIMKKLTKSKKRKSLEELIISGHDKRNEKIDDILDKARWAPSAVNRQPWRFSLQENGIVIKSSKKGKNIMLDLGICLSHIDIAAKRNGLDGEILIKDKLVEYIF